jgi:hypothetical protein
MHGVGNGVAHGVVDEDELKLDVVVQNASDNAVRW